MRQNIQDDKLWCAYWDEGKDGKPNMPETPAGRALITLCDRDDDR